MPIYIPKIKVRYQSINEILTIKEYWTLIGREPFLAIITWEPDFSQACSFWRMLKDHKNFRFTTISDKTKNLIFLKCPKTLVFDPFWHNFFQKKSCCHIIVTRNNIVCKLARGYCLLLQNFFATARPYRVHQKFCYWKV